ncbi:TfoX/Sxy family protein [Aeromicrobium ginsengisoli]|uniref:TfoX/Sxy family protein n=1 Tax=Aeromicrobium ginsengisoli TaxID=363867 RepID=A0A5M4FJL4_9ACTN|nr:TfoX/Sxy family protein [Aeromicrobium ginsengisoli]KAA1400337.1 TfoX/Sxy family protein [Aeromicrobium ginsengisoli]
MDAEARFDEIVDDLAPRGVLPGALFGARSLTVEGTAFACLKGGQLAVKLGDGTAAHADALAMDGASLFDPSGKGRPFKDWVAVPAAEAQAWGQLAEAGLDALGGAA